MPLSQLYFNAHYILFAIDILLATGSIIYAAPMLQIIFVYIDLFIGFIDWYDFYSFDLIWLILFLLIDLLILSI